MPQSYTSNGLNTAPSVSNEPENPDPQRQWMVQFCVEPPGDLDTCCLSWWVPCAQYGKTHWRLKRQFFGEDPTDASWHSAYVCNGACFLFLGLELFCLRLGSGILAGLERHKIRRTYGIDGDDVVDFVASICCTACVLMQNDREVRARTNPEFRARAYGLRPIYCTSTQPALTQSMRYASQPREAASGPNTTSPSLVREHNVRSGRYAEPQVFPESRNAGPLSTHQQIPLRGMHALHHIESNQPRNKPLTLPNNLSMEGKEMDSNHGNLTLQASESQVQKNQASKNDQGPSSQRQDLSDVEVENHTVKTSKVPHSHVLSDRITGGADGVWSECLAECETLVATTSHPGSKRDSTTATDSRELSYVHDFTDCPVDRKVLEYYEKEEKRSCERAQANCSRTNFTGNAKSYDLSQNALIDSAQSRPTEGSLFCGVANGLQDYMQMIDLQSPVPPHNALALDPTYNGRVTEDAHVHGISAPSSVFKGSSAKLSDYHKRSRYNKVRSSEKTVTRSTEYAARSTLKRFLRSQGYENDRGRLSGCL